MLNNEYITMANLLLQHQADPNIVDRRGWSILHQCAVSGNLPLLQLCVNKGGDVRIANDEGHKPVDLAKMRGHEPIVKYLEVQSGSLRCFCRLAVREAMGKRAYNKIDSLPLPAMMKLFVNYGIPYQGWRAPLIVDRPWSEEDIVKGIVPCRQVREFVEEVADPEFTRDKKLNEKTTPDELAEIMESLYFWESFKTIDYKEPLPRKPRYSMDSNCLAGPPKILGIFNRV